MTKKRKIIIIIGVCLTILAGVVLVIFSNIAVKTKEILAVYEIQTLISTLDDEVIVLYSNRQLKHMKIDWVDEYEEEEYTVKELLAETEISKQSYEGIKALMEAVKETPIEEIPYNLNVLGGTVSYKYIIDGEEIRFTANSGQYDATVYVLYRALHDELYFEESVS